MFRPIWTGFALYSSHFFARLSELHYFALVTTLFLICPSQSHSETANVQTGQEERILSASNNYSVTLPENEVAKVTARLLEQDKQPRVSLKGWDYLYSLLLDEGLDPKELWSIFSDSRMPKRETLFFSLDPKESPSLYRRHNTRAARENALTFYKAHRQRFIEAEQRFGVSRSIILSLLQIESGCGTFTGNQMVFHRLARLSAASTPDNVAENFRDKKSSFKLLTLERVQNRASILQELFLKHTAATIEVAKGVSVHPLELKGSGAGAMGLPQFLPGNIKEYGVDADANGKIDIYDPDDAIHSVAKFLNSYGWDKKKALTTNEKRQILLNYNRSGPYVNTALAMAKQLEPKL